MNKYLVKIAEVSKKLEGSKIDHSRMLGRGALYAGATGYGVSKILPKHPISSVLAIGAGGLAFGEGTEASYRNQLKEQQLHDIKLEGARQREELHQAKMNKYAEMSDKTKDTLKDVAGTGVIAGLGGIGTVAAGKLAGANPSAKKLMALGTGIGLVADYAGIRINKAMNKKIEDHL